MGEMEITRPMPYTDEDLVAILKALPANSLEAAHLTERQEQILRERNLLTDHGFNPGYLRERVGKDLYQALFPGDVGSAFRAALNLARQQSEMTVLALQLRFDEDAVELARYPWELLHDGRRHLLPSRAAELTRYISYPEAPTPLEVEPPLRMLYIQSRPLDQEMLSSEEQETTFAALEPLRQQGLVKVDQLEPPTYDELAKRLDRNRYHILHFDGHGAPGMLAFETPDHKTDPIESKLLGTLLYNSKIRLAVLSACSSGEVQETDLFSGVGPALIQAGVPAVVVMQMPISVEATNKFMDGFYNSLTHLASPSAAMTLGRRLLLRGTEWFIPTLYLRSKDEGRLLFKMKSP